MTIRALRPVQVVGVPDKVRIKVSQFTPSTHVLSSVEPPPTAVPAQFTVGPPGFSVPALGVAERKPVAKNANTTRKTPITKKRRAISAGRGNDKGDFFKRKRLE